MLKHVISLIRVKHWIKNCLIFLPAFFGGVIKEPEVLKNLLLIFLCFSFTASLVYVFNDLMDLEKDKVHPKKKNRALASGNLSVKQAYILFAAIFLIVVLLSTLLPVNVVIITAIYLIINILYSLGLKKVPILELFIVAVGFLFRIFIGGFGAEVEPSKWIVMLTFFGALYIVITKRKGELLNIEADNSRDVLKQYSLEYLNLAMIILATVSIVAYIMYTVEPDVISRFATDKIYLTSFIAIFILLRHLQQTIKFNKTESPVEYLYKDKVNLIAILVWLLVFYILIYNYK